MTRKLLSTGLSATPVYSLIGVMLLVCLGVTEYVVSLAQQRAEQVKQMEATVVLARMRARMESEINSVLYLSRSLTTFITVQPQSTPERWRELSREIVGEAPLVRNIGLAPDNVIRFVYPLQGNEAAIGLDYSENTKQWPAVAEAMLSGRMKLAGPISLIQGGHGLVARTPIYYHEGAVRHYWGLASIVVDYDQLLAKADVHEVLGEFNIAIRGVDGQGEQGDLFFGKEVVFDKALATMPVYFPNGSWVMAASLTQQALPSVVILRLVSWLIIAILAGGAVLVFQLYRLAHKQSLTDALTGTANRRLLMYRAEQLSQLHARTGDGFAVLFIDLNHFKQVNDTFGHHAGDRLLIQAAARIEQNTRVSDTLARNGGDEFIVLQPGVAQEHVEQLASKIEALMAEPFIIDGLTLSISASVGYAVFPDDGHSAGEIINLADSRMYERKREKKQLEKKQEGEG